MHKFRFEIRTFREVRFWERVSVKARRKKLLFQYEASKVILAVAEN